jgi:hypothetical protein
MRAVRLFLPVIVRRVREAFTFATDRQTLCQLSQDLQAKFYNGNQFHTMSSWREFCETKATARMTQVYIFHEA